MKNKIIIITILLLSVFTIVLTAKFLTNSPVKKGDNIKEITKKDTFAIMISDDDGNNYKEYEEDTFPDSIYEFKKANCVDNAGNKIDGILTFDENTRKATVKTNKTVYCTLYFNKIIGGNGTEKYPYEIKYVEDLVKLSNSVSKDGNVYKDQYFILKNDIDFANIDNYQDYQSKDYGDINGNGTDEELKTELTSGSGFIPIGSNTSRFQGNFDGNSKKIDNLYIDNTKLSNAGLFGVVTNAHISNLTVGGSVKTSLISETGGIISTAINSTIENCHNYVNVYSAMPNSSVGGIMGTAELNVNIRDCTNHGKIENGNNTGGLVGFGGNVNLTIENSHNYGIVSNTKGTHLGGLIGRDNITTSKIIIKNSINEGTVMTNRETINIAYAGGIIGRVYGGIEIIDSYNKGEIKDLRTTYSTGTEVGLGGIIGLTNSGDNVKIENSYNTGTITGGNRIGGMVGYNIGGNVIINHCYNTGKFETTLKIGTYATVVGGITGYTNGGYMYILNSYNTGEIHSKEHAGGIIGAGTASSQSAIINSYNNGKVTSDSTAASGIYGYLTTSSNVIINNVYNTGVLSGKNTNGILYIDNGTYNVNNAYFLNNVSTGSNLSNSNIVTTSMTQANMQNATFSHTLTNNVYNKVNLGTLIPLLKDYQLYDWVTTGNSYPTFARKIEDLSGNERTGMSHAVEWTKDGLTTSNDTTTGYVYMGLEDYDFDKDLSFVVRVKFNKLDGYREFMGNWEGAGGGFAISTNKIGFALHGEDLVPPDYLGPTSTDVTVINKWYTVVGTYDNKSIKLYINGEEKGSTNLTGGITPTSTFMALGGNPNNWQTDYGLSNYSYTTFSDVLVFDRALSAEEIKENYSEIPVPVDKSQLLLWYKF